MTTLENLQNEYDHETESDNECDNCAHWQERGDILFDELEQAHKSIASLEATLEAAVEMREANGKLRELLRINNIEFEF